MRWVPWSGDSRNPPSLRAIGTLSRNCPNKHGRKEKGVKADCKGTPVTHPAHLDSYFVYRSEVLLKNLKDAMQKLNDYKWLCLSRSSGQKERVRAIDTD